MKCNSTKLKREFGKFLQHCRELNKFSCYDLAYILGISHSTISYWESGHSFPSSIIRLKKLALLRHFKGIPIKLKRIQNAMVPSDSKWKEFLESIENRPTSVSDPESGRRCYYEPNDPRDKQHKIAFGNYLKQERLDRDIGPVALARALGVADSCCYRWESGTAFPQDPKVLVMLNKLYGNLFQTLFAVCPENGITLLPEEIKMVKVRLEDIGTGGLWAKNKPKPAGWARYLEKKRGWSTSPVAKR